MRIIRIRTRICVPAYISRDLYSVGEHSLTTTKRAAPVQKLQVQKLDSYGRQHYTVAN